MTPYCARMRYAATRSSRCSMSVRLYAGCSYDARPARELALDTRAERLRLAARRLESLLGEHVAHIRLFQQVVHIAVHPLDDRGCRAGRREHRVPGFHLELGQARFL